MTELRQAYDPGNPSQPSQCPRPAPPGIYVVPVLDRFLIYAPLLSVAALADGTAVQRLRAELPLHRGAAPVLRSALAKQEATSPTAPVSSGLIDLSLALNEPAVPAPEPRRGPFLPAFLGILPTRGCNLACRYCGFQACDGPQRAMEPALARAAVDWYLGIIASADAPAAEIHFFGGEPFHAPQVPGLVVPYARMKAREIGCTLRFEVATNGAMDERRCRWAADNLDTIVLSLDGPPDIQDRYRPRRGDAGSSPDVIRSARLLSEGAAELNLRACVTAETVSRMPEVAAWFCREFRPTAVSFEPLQPSAESEAAHLEPPDPWAFGRAFVAAARILEAHGVEPVYATADIAARRVSFCPVGHDAAIVSPSGAISACYLLPQEWQARGMDLHLGYLTTSGAQINPEAVARTRSLNVYHKPHCTGCFCRWHCAGGCHVNHLPPGAPGAYDRLCIQTRIITLRNLLHAMGCDALAAAWLADRTAMERTVGQATDSLWNWSPAL